MPIIEKRMTLSGLLVKEAMRKQVIHLLQHATIDNGISILIKYKVNALLIIDENGLPTGVVSKTDIMGAYYAGLPLEISLENIMSSPPFFCSPDDSLESALDTMREKGIKRLYVKGDQPEAISGVLAYSDIVGLLYLYCHRCDYSILRRKRKKETDASIRRYTVKEVMTPSVKAYPEDASLTYVMEELSKYHFGAVLITDRNNLASGVVSKTDLSLSYKHGIDPETKTKAIMSSPARSCGENDFLEDAIQTMIYSDVHRLFVHSDDPQNVVGVLSLSDASRIRSGSCHGCISSRIRVDEQD
jgi:CBS domain-containing protein